ncbi:MAG: acetate/propionate family kinase [Syntrophales bacterium]|nr:acetate/propionate family kinase [Syntrophales bacterium]MDD5642317.1 acetate/propionate family kinase [Syntrophales bacterium]
MGRDSHILTINSGSSSIKFSLYILGKTEDLVLQGDLERIGLAGGVFQARDHAGRQLVAQELDLPDHNTALKALFTWFEGHAVGQNLHAVGHRLVHGGRDHVQPQKVSPALLADLKLLIPLAPDHLPHEIKGLEGVQAHFPDLLQVACFDTAFHRRMPEVAQRYALPASLVEAGVRHYGFHGLSYEYITQELARELGSPHAAGKLIIAHLGNGASMAAIEEGRSLDTTMGMTPAGGLVMSTRCGDLDPGVVIYLLREKGLAPDAVNNLINRQAGLLGVSGTSGDMHDLLGQEKTNPDAALAVELFCYQARKFIGALAAVLGGLDTLVFTGGIGEHAAAIRARLCGPLGFLGLHLAPDLNQANAPIISPPKSPVTVRVMKTNEELMIARHTRELLAVASGS